MPQEMEPKKDQKLVAKESDVESGQKKQTVNPQYTFETGDHAKGVAEEEGLRKLLSSMDPGLKKMFLSILVLQFFQVLVSVSLGVAGESLV